MGEVAGVAVNQCGAVTARLTPCRRLVAAGHARCSYHFGHWSYGNRVGKRALR